MFLNSLIGSIAITLLKLISITINVSRNETSHSFVSDSSQ